MHGGRSIDLIGLVSQVVHRGRGHVLRSIPGTLMCKEIIGETVGKDRHVVDAYQRKA